MAVQTTIYLIVITCFVVYAGQACASNSATNTSVGESRAHPSFGTGRTFGQIKKFQTALLPIMYKLGVMSAIIMMTLFLAFKGVFIGTLILVMNLTFFAIKFGLYLKQDHNQPSISYAAPSHSSEPIWPQIPSGPSWGPHKDVHLHIHNGHSKTDYTLPFSSYGNLPSASAQQHHWADSPIVASEAPHWNANSYGHQMQLREPYGHTGRAMPDNDLSAFASNAQHTRATQQVETVKVTSMPEKTIEKPSVVTSEPKTMVDPMIVPPITTYHFVHNQNRQ